ncbi:hypothetical protein NGF19_22690 [Streptomyces sp. RY43-2]|uniref:Integral membrane protein n=1 Tax=Streptomyces macrolidinus TaxID=2952607 RepID=A0ABT0ZJ04_9ACTN|nr:hypothetical protein [Streptomyces macrolidinus]MCN9243560.1 hypothetical protein [Streptomyces macrolidinus]
MTAQALVGAPGTLLRHELRLLASIVLWAARRTHGTREGHPFGYVRGQGALLLGLGFVCVVETVGLAVLLRPWPVAHAVMLALDVYAVLMVVGLHAASVTRPHVLTPTALRLRRATQVDLSIPLERIARVRRELRTTHERAEGVLDLPVGAQTSVTLELTEPVTHVPLFGRPRPVAVVRFHTDDADRFVAALGHAVR